MTVCDLNVWAQDLKSLQKGKMFILTTTLKKYCYAAKQFFRKFYGDAVEKEVHYSNELLADALVGGDKTTKEVYIKGKLRSASKL